MGSRAYGKIPVKTKIKSLAARFLGPALLGSAAVLASGGACLAVAEYRDHVATSALDRQVTEMLGTKKLTAATVENFRRDDDCGSRGPYGADFKAEDATKTAVSGHICWAPSGESFVYLRQR